MIPRARLVRRLVSAGAVPIVTLVAPAGYGKTTVLAEWALRDERSFRWLGPHDDPDDALRTITTAAARRIPQVIVFDDAHDAAPETVRELMQAATRLPLGAVLAVASRRRLPAANGRLRAHRLLVDVAPRELVMSRLEAAMLLDAAGARLDGEQVDRLVERTEGWPVALYLAALSLSEQDDVDAATSAFSGADRLMFDYMDCELLADVSADQRTFLRRTSLLGRLSGALCDAVLETRARPTPSPSYARPACRSIRSTAPIWRSATTRCWPRLCVPSSRAPSATSSRRCTRARPTGTTGTASPPTPSATRSRPATRSARAGCCGRSRRSTRARAGRRSSAPGWPRSGSASAPQSPRSRSARPRTTLPKGGSMMPSAPPSRPSALSRPRRAPVTSRRPSRCCSRAPPGTAPPAWARTRRRPTGC